MSEMSNRGSMQGPLGSGVKGPNEKPTCDATRKACSTLLRYGATPYVVQ